MATMKNPTKLLPRSEVSLVNVRPSAATILASNILSRNPSANILVCISCQKMQRTLNHGSSEELVVWAIASHGIYESASHVQSREYNTSDARFPLHV